MIVSKETGLVLDVKGGGKSPGTEVILWEKSGNDNQVWYEHPSTGTVRSKHNDLCLDFNSEYYSSPSIALAVKKAPGWFLYYKSIQPSCELLLHPPQ